MTRAELMGVIDAAIASIPERDCACRNELHECYACSDRYHDAAKADRFGMDAKRRLQDGDVSGAIVALAEACDAIEKWGDADTLHWLEPLRLATAYARERMEQCGS